MLLLALVGVWSLAPDRLWGGTPGLHAFRDAQHVAASRPIAAPVGIVVGVYIFWVGAELPGGAFQGGAILAAMWLIVMMARPVEDVPPTGRRWMRSSRSPARRYSVLSDHAGFAGPADSSPIPPVSPSR